MMKKYFPLFLPAALSLAVWLPVLFLAGGSLMGTAELTKNLSPVLNETYGYASWDLLPHFPTLRPYVRLLLDQPQFFVMFWNSVKLTGAILIGQIIFGVPAAWDLPSLIFQGKNIYLLFILYLCLCLFR